MRRVEEVIIASSYVATEMPKIGAVGTATWADGGINILKEDMSELVTADITAAYDGPIHITRFDRQNQLRLSFKIDKKEIRRYAYKDFAAEAFQVSDVSMPAAPVVGTAYGFYLIDPHDREVVYNGRKLVYVVAVTGETQATLRDRLIAAVNSDATLTVTASATGTSVRLTADAGKKFLEGYERHHAFTVALYAGLIGETITATTAHSLGCGEFMEVYNLENDLDLGYKGHLNRVLYADQPERYADSSCDYDMYVIEHNRVGGDSVADNASASRPLTTIIAFKESGTGAAAFKTLLDGYMGVELDNNPNDAE